MGPSIGCALEGLPGAFTGALGMQRQNLSARQISRRSLPSIDSPNSRDLSLHLGTTGSIRLGGNQAAFSVIPQ